MAHKKNGKSKHPSHGGNGKHPGGRPTLYKPEYCKKIIEFFTQDPHQEVVKKRVTTKQGDEIEEFELRANDMRFFSQFARKIGVNTSTLYEWEKKFPEFSDALNSAREMQFEHLVINGLQASFNPFFAFQTAKNMFGWRDKQPGEKDDDALNKLLDIIKKQQERPVDDTLPINRLGGLQIVN